MCVAFASLPFARVRIIAVHLIMDTDSTQMRQMNVDI